MKVLTLTPERFTEACHELERMIPTRPDVVLGIASGGVYVADEIFSGLPHAQVACRRPSTSRKERHSRLTAMLRHMPIWMCDMLRRIEAHMLAGRERPVPAVEVPRSVIDAKTILVVDDAVDSGATMQAVVRTVEKANPAAHVVTAAVVVTTKTPAVRPDYHLYDNILIRFPWAHDYR